MAEPKILLQENRERIKRKYLVNYTIMCFLFFIIYTAWFLCFIVK